MSTIKNQKQLEAIIERNTAPYCYAEYVANGGTLSQGAFEAERTWALYNEFDTNYEGLCIRESKEVQKETSIGFSVAGILFASTIGIGFLANNPQINDVGCKAALYTLAVFGTLTTFGTGYTATKLLHQSLLLQPIKENENQRR